MRSAPPVFRFGGRRLGAGATRGRPERRRRPVLTPRALVLGGLVVLFVVVLASPLHRYLGSRHDVSAAARQLQRDDAALRRLSAQKARWSDPGYVQRQARLRLMYAMPGDTVYTVVRPGLASGFARTSGPKPRVAGPDTWSTRLWHSVEAAST